MAEGHKAGGKRAAVIAVCAAAVLAGIFGAYRLGRSAGSGGDIGEETAKSIALGHAAVSESGLSSYEIARDEAGSVYEVEFTAGSCSYAYVVSAADGSVVKFEKKPDTQSTPSPASAAPASGNSAPASAEGSAPQSGQSVQGTLTADAVSYIGEARAKEIAYGHACLTADAVTHCGVELDHHGGGHHGGHGSHHGAGCCTYEIGFQSGGYEYEYRIDAITGEILGFEQEMHH